MPSPLAHSVSGYVLSTFLPVSLRQHSKWLPFFYPVFVASAADLDFIPQLLTGAAYHRGLTHSLIFAVAFSTLCGLCLNFKKLSTRRLSLFTFILYSSHLLLDFFSAGRGIKLFFPFIDRYFRSPVTVFPGIHHSRGLWDYGHIAPLVFELGYSILLCFILWWRSNSQSLRS
ncbi:MAG: metal-dependent hydrolase [Cyanophyceae cyanobacterium]